MSPIYNCIKNSNTDINPIWIMRQAGRYLPEFRKIRKENPDFVKLCLNENLSSEITLQPLRRFDLDAAIIFSDILMIPFGLNQNVTFKKGFGPELGELNFSSLKEITETSFNETLMPIYNSLKITKKDNLIKNKDLFGFVGAPWTLLVYMINKQSPKKKLISNFFEDEKKLLDLVKLLVKFTKLHIKNQIENGATIIQIFDSWAGILDEKYYKHFIYSPTIELVEFVKSLEVPVICFPRGIKNYIEFSKVVNPDVISIDYDINPTYIRKNINIPVQGGLDPKFLLGDIETLRTESKKYLDIFQDHPYIFNLGHGILPETNPENLDYLVKFVKNYQ